MQGCGVQGELGPAISPEPARMDGTTPVNGPSKGAPGRREMSPLYRANCCDSRKTAQQKRSSLRAPGVKLTRLGAAGRPCGAARL